MVPETPADKNVPFFEVGSCSWGTYWQFRPGRFLIRFLQVIYEGHSRLLIMRKINKFSLYSQYYYDNPNSTYHRISYSLVQCVFVVLKFTTQTYTPLLNCLS